MELAGIGLVSHHESAIRPVEDFKNQLHDLGQQLVQIRDRAKGDTHLHHGLHALGQFLVQFRIFRYLIAKLQQDL